MIVGQAVGVLVSLVSLKRLVSIGSERVNPRFSVAFKVSSATIVNA